jgi:hypothetical protein
VQGTVKHGSESIMLWCCMTIHGYRLLMKIDGKMNQILYKQILEVGLTSTIHYHELDLRCLIFQ